MKAAKEARRRIKAPRPDPPCHAPPHRRARFAWRHGPAQAQGVGFHPTVRRGLFPQNRAPERRRRIGEGGPRSRKDRLRGARPPGTTAVPPLCAAFLRVVGGPSGISRPVCGETSRSEVGHLYRYTARGRGPEKGSSSAPRGRFCTKAAGQARRGFADPPEAAGLRFARRPRPAPLVRPRTSATPAGRRAAATGGGEGSEAHVLGHGPVGKEG